MAEPSRAQKRRRLVVYVAATANATIAVAKFIAAAVTSSPSMLAEAIHSVVDTGNELLLAFGLHASRKPADLAHPFGHGKELYFWSMVVALVVFGIGGGMALFEGIFGLVERGHGNDRLGWNYAVLGVAAVFEGTSWVLSFRTLRRRRREESVWQLVQRSKDPSVFTPFLEDSAALVGVVLAFGGTLGRQLLDSRVPDAIASIAIGCLLGAEALVLIRETKGLLVGERADARSVQQIRAMAEQDAAVQAVGQPYTMQLGPDEVLLNLDVRFRPDLSAGEQIEAVDRLERRIRGRYPEVKRIFIEAAAMSGRVEDR